MVSGEKRGTETKDERRERKGIFRMANDQLNTGTSFDHNFQTYRSLKLQQ